MEGLTTWLRAGILMLAAMVGCAAASSDEGWLVRDFKSFTLRTPADWSLMEGGADSLAGRLKGPGVQIEYDLGLYSDPLTAPFGAQNLQTKDETIDGLSARWVSYSQSSETGTPARSCIGVHVPQVRRSSLGRIRFTALACTQDPAQLVLARSVLATLHFPDSSLR